MQLTETAWLKSPVSARAEQLRPLHRMALEPFEGRRSSMKLVRTHYVIGSGEDCDIQLRDPYVSPRHAEISVQEGGVGYAVKDLNSRNGIFLNGVQVLQAPLPLRGNLRLGRSTLVWAPEPIGEEPCGDYIAADPAMKEAIVALKKMAATSLPVLLLGETGTGKDVLARMLHQWSARSQGPYVAVNGALTGGSLSESELFGHRKGAFTGADKMRLGALRSANGGSLFLDEVADIPAPAQVKLLRSLECGEVRPLGSDRAERADFRLISATSQNIDEHVESGAFRMDLFFRIAGHVVHVPPLRERPLDILAMARIWLGESDQSLSSECEGMLLSYRWPGNVRELKASIERARVNARCEGSEMVLPRHLAGFSRNGVRIEPAIHGHVRTLDQIEKESILSSLERHGWCRSRAAKELGVARSTLFYKMKRFELRDKVNGAG